MKPAPHDAQTWHSYATALSANGEAAAALDAITTARRLDPSSTPIAADFGLLAYLAVNRAEGLAPLYGALSFGGVPSRFDLINNMSTGFDTAINYLDNYPSGHPDTWTTNSDHTLNISQYTFDITGPTATLPFDLNADLRCHDGFLCNYADTAKFSLVLQPGTTFTSDSGAFLTASGTPEPAMWVLMVLGFGAVGRSMRRRSAVVAARAKVTARSLSTRHLYIQSIGCVFQHAPISNVANTTTHRGLWL